MPGLSFEINAVSNPETSHSFTFIRPNRSARRAARDERCSVPGTPHLALFTLIWHFSAQAVHVSAARLLDSFHLRVRFRRMEPLPEGLGIQSRRFGAVAGRVSLVSEVLVLLVLCGSIVNTLIATHRAFFSKRVSGVKALARTSAELFAGLLRVRDYTRLDGRFLGHEGGGPSSSNSTAVSPCRPQPEHTAYRPHPLHTRLSTSYSLRSGLSRSSTKGMTGPSWHPH